MTQAGSSKKVRVTTGGKVKAGPATPAANQLTRPDNILPGAAMPVRVVDAAYVAAHGLKAGEPISVWQVTDGAVEAGAATPVYLVSGIAPEPSSDWSYRKQITVNSSEVVSPLSDFPVLISFTDPELAHTSYGGGVQFTDGSDIAFLDTDGVTLLSYELEKYEYSTGELAAWVKIPSIDNITDVQFYIYYGNASTLSLEQQNDVWDSDFEAILHMQEPSSATGVTRDTASYDAFPILIQVGDDAFLAITRTGADHVGNDGKIIKVPYDASLNSWGAAADIYDSVYDDRNPAGGKIGDDIYIFLARYDDGVAWIDLGYIKSTDNGATWSGYTAVTIDASLAEYSPYGHIVQVGNTYYQPYYGWDAGLTTYKIKLLQSIDDGATWTDGPTIYSGATNYNETCVEYLGGTNLIALSRNEAGGPMRQFKSVDSGATWSDDGDTNLGAAGDVTMGWVVRYGQRIVSTYMSRGDDKLYVSEVTPSVVGNPTSWVGNFTIATGLSGASGYPSMLRWKPSHFMLLYYKEVGANDADLSMAVYPEQRIISSDDNLIVGALYQTSPTQGAGQIDGSFGFSGSQGFHLATLGYMQFLQNTGVFTIELWAKQTNYLTADTLTFTGDTFGSADKGFAFAYENSAGVGTKELRLFLARGAIGTPIIDSRSSDNAISDNNWHYIVASGDGTSVTFYIDGVLDAGSGTMGALSTGNATRDGFIGGANFNPLPITFFIGSLDEIRFSSIQRATEWIQTCFNNQNAPGTFITVGLQEEL